MPAVPGSGIQKKRLTSAKSPVVSRVLENNPQLHEISWGDFEYSPATASRCDISQLWQ
jgi:hypothetical protein